MKRLIFCMGLVVLSIAAGVVAQEKPEKQKDSKFEDQKMIDFHITRVLVKNAGADHKEYWVWGESATSKFELYCLGLGTTKKSRCGDLRVGEDIKALRGVYSDASTPPKGIILFVPHHDQSAAMYELSEETEKPGPVSGLIPGGNIYSTSKPIGEQRQPCSGVTPLNIILLLLWILTLLWGAIWRTSKRRAVPSQISQPTAPNPSNQT